MILKYLFDPFVGQKIKNVHTADLELGGYIVLKESLI